MIGYTVTHCSFTDTCRSKQYNQRVGWFIVQRGFSDNWTTGIELKKVQILEINLERLDGDI